MKDDEEQQTRPAVPLRIGGFSRFLSQLHAPSLKYILCVYTTIPMGTNHLGRVPFLPLPDAKWRMSSHLSSQLGGVGV